MALLLLAIGSAPMLAGLNGSLAPRLVAAVGLAAPLLQRLMTAACGLRRTILPIG